MTASNPFEPTRERGIPFSPPMVRAVLAGEKTQTRRVYKPQPVFGEVRRGRRMFAVSGNGSEGLVPEEEVSRILTPAGRDPEFPSPYGAPGDQLVLLSTWATEARFDAVRPTDLPAGARLWSHWDGIDKPEWCGKSRPARFLAKSLRARMPRAEVTGVRVERLQAISDVDIRAEGLACEAIEPDLRRLLRMGRCDAQGRDPFDQLDLHGLWSRGWDAINGKRPGCTWADNCWVWVIEFRRLS